MTTGRINQITMRWKGLCFSRF